MDEATLCQLARENLHEFYRRLAAASGAGGALDEQGGVLRYASSTDFPVTMNGATRVDDSVPAEKVLDLSERFFAGRGHGYTLQVQDPDGVDAGLVAAAEARGLVTLGHAPAMVCRQRLADAVVPDGIVLRWVDAEDGTDTRVADGFVSVSDRAYQSLGMTAGVIEDAFVRRDLLGVEGVRSVVAFDGATPLAAAQLITSRHDGGITVAGVYYVGTVEAARGRGLGELVTRAVTNLGFDQGAAFASLQATVMGEPIYRRMGYEQIATYRALVRF